MKMSAYLIIASFVLFLYYILKIYVNCKMKFILFIINCVSMLCIIIDFVFIGNQKLFDIMFATECLNILIWFYYLFDKSNFELYSILAETKAIPIMIGYEWFIKGNREINSIVDFFKSNIILMNKSKDISIIMLNRKEKTTDLFLIFSKSTNVDFYKAKIINNSTYNINSKGRCLVIRFERDY